MTLVKDQETLIDHVHAHRATICEQIRCAPVFEPGS